MLPTYKAILTKDHVQWQDEVPPSEQPILDGAVALRQQRRMSLGDSLIAATALVHGLTLVTHNTNDFRWVTNLLLHDPLAPAHGS